jgi:hypothetical protein
VREQAGQHANSNKPRRETPDDAKGDLWSASTAVLSFIVSSRRKPIWASYCGDALTSKQAVRPACRRSARDSR